MGGSNVMRVLFLMLICASAYAQKIEEGEVPAKIRAVVKEKGSGNKVDLWMRDNVRTKYVASLLADGTIPMIIEVGFDGQWISTTEALQPNKVPAIVMRSIREKYLTQGFDGDNFIRVHDRNDGTYYAADVTSDDEDLQVRLDSKGKILSIKNR